jgi:hypothetical protein
VGNYTVCDNVDLKMVLTEFESYHQVTHTPQIQQNACQNCFNNVLSPPIFFPDEQLFISYLSF